MIVGKSFSPFLVVDVPMGFDDVTGRGHRVGLVVRSVQPDPPTLRAHPNRLVLTEAGDVPGQNRTAVALKRPFLHCLDPPGEDQRVVRKIGKLAKDLRLVDRAIDAPSELALFDPFGRDQEWQQLLGAFLSGVGGGVEGADRLNVPPRAGLANRCKVGCGIIGVTNGNNASVKFGGQGIDGIEDRLRDTADLVDEVIRSPLDRCGSAPDRRSPDQRATGLSDGGVGRRPFERVARRQLCTSVRQRSGPTMIKG
jgi:hypothetical protein